MNLKKINFYQLFYLLFLAAEQTHEVLQHLHGQHN